MTVEAPVSRVNETVHMPGGWRFDKTFNLGHVLTVIAVTAPMFLWGSTVETRLTVIERMQADQAIRQDRNAADLKERMDRDARMAEAQLRDLKALAEAQFRDIKEWLRVFREDVRKEKAGG